ncbi:hypothetical protein [Halarcobacter ebronensis]|uniref:GGDEF domain-containing protein n=1 Tax=Halarcobacter ebronensis TaxID=1462615 RepID=A0A4Q1AGS5_9BACT|nr:hypothetical protein [Halarcobacter ebronensis]QKF81406.1 hypothetical protein AEBR_0907 [Halarcobacter ebronensis]RXK01834.1 hypothetical protein CRV07_14510 [Halarcobacter ebronensis]
MFIHQEKDILNFIDEEGEDHKVSQLLTKYNIKISNSLIYSLHDDYSALLNYIDELYFNEKDIPSDIVEELLNNLNFKSFIIYALEKKMNSIINDNATIIFKEISTIIDILSFGKKFSIFNSYNSYNLDNLSSLFKEYEERLKILYEANRDDFEITFKHYTILIEVINELCSINSLDILRKKSIKPLVEIITETISMSKFNIELDSEKINILNNILGKLLFFYSHVPYIDTANKDSSYLIEEFHFNFEKICYGYDLSKNTGFGLNVDEKPFYKIFLNSTTTLLLTLLYKLKYNYSSEDFSNTEELNQIITLYKNEIKHKKNHNVETLEDLKKDLLENYIYIYDENVKEKDHLFIVDEFLNNENFKSVYLSILHTTILFSTQIQEEKLISVLEKFSLSQKYNNDYHEFLKLSICDVIITKFIAQRKITLKDELIDKIINYIHKNRTASHQMSTYAKLYLTISLYYSFSDNYNCIEKSKLYYFYYVSVNGYELLDNEYSKINRTILINHGNQHINELNLENVLISDAKCLEVGENALNKYFVQEEMNKKNRVNQKLSNIVTQIFTDKNLDNELLNKEIENFISNEIFFGLTFVSVDGLCKQQCTLVDIGYERISITLFDEYKLRIAYSKVFKQVFERLYIDNSDYIKQNIINLIICYLRSNLVYNDSVTGLRNHEKFKTDILKRDDKEFILVQLYYEDLFRLNKTYGYEKINHYFREYIKIVEKITPLYRFNGPKIGFIVENSKKYKALIEEIKNIEMLVMDELINPRLTIAITWGNKNNILEKATLCLNFAEDSKEGYYEFK